MYLQQNSDKQKEHDMVENKQAVYDFNALLGCWNAKNEKCSSIKHQQTQT